MQNVLNGGHTHYSWTMRAIMGISSVCLLACVPPSSTSPSYFGQQQPQQAQPYEQQPQTQAQATTGGSNCLQMFQCLAACADGACMQACYGQGDAEAQQAAAALIQCGQGGGACEPELARCRGNAVVASAPPAPSAPLQVGASGKRQPVANDQILPWLTGSWIGNNHQFEFYGDGRVRRSGGGMMREKVPGERGRDCVAVSNDTGTVTQQGDLLIMKFEAADGYTCGIREHDPGVTVRYRIEWVDNPYYDLNELQLRLIDIDCTAGEMWCADRVTRRR